MQISNVPGRLRLVEKKPGNPAFGKALLSDQMGTTTGKHLRFKFHPLVSCAKVSGMDQSREKLPPPYHPTRSAIYCHDEHTWNHPLTSPTFLMYINEIACPLRRLYRYRPMLPIWEWPASGIQKWPPQRCRFQHRFPI